MHRYILLLNRDFLYRSHPLAIPPTIKQKKNGVIITIKLTFVMPRNQGSGFDTSDDFSVCVYMCVISRIVTTGERASHTAIGPNSVAEQSTSTVPLPTPPAVVDAAAAAASTTLPAPKADDTTTVAMSTATTGRRYRTGRRWTPRPWRRTAGIVWLIAVIDGTVVVAVAVIIAVVIAVITDGVQRRDADSRRRIARIILLLSLCTTYDTAI